MIWSRPERTERTFDAVTCADHGVGWRVLRRCQQALGATRSAVWWHGPSAAESASRNLGYAQTVLMRKGT